MRLIAQKMIQEKNIAKNDNVRVSRTRTLIQLGGLLLKSGVLEHFKIALGEDLQLHKESRDKASTLLGGLMLLKEQLSDKDENFFDELFLIGDAQLK